MIRSKGHLPELPANRLPLRLADFCIDLICRRPWYWWAATKWRSRLFYILHRTAQRLDPGYCAFVQRERDFWSSPAHPISYGINYWLDSTNTPPPTPE